MDKRQPGMVAEHSTVPREFKPNYEELWSFIQGDVDSGNHKLRDVANELVPELKKLQGTWPERLQKFVATCEKIGNGQYCILRNLNNGGTGIVQLALDLKKGLLVAAKSINPKNGPDEPETNLGLDVLEYRRKAFIREMETIKKLGDNPFLIKIFDIVPGKHAQSIIMEYLSQGDLASRVYTPDVTQAYYGVYYQRPPVYSLGRSSTDRLTASVAIQTCLGLDYMHEKGIVHLDVKPENIFMVSENNTPGHESVRVKIGDFDLSNVHEELKAADSKLTAGSVEYMSPEMATGQWNLVAPHSDIYSLGAVLYYMNSGKLPYENVKHGDRFYQKPVDLSEQRHGEKYTLDEIIMRMVQARLSGRSRSALNIAKQVKTIMAQQYPGIEREYPYNLLA